MQLRDTAAKQAEAAATAEAVVAVARRWSIFAKLPAMCCSMVGSDGEDDDRSAVTFVGTPFFPDLFFPHRHRVFLT